MTKIPVGILGATGMVGQNYLKLLENHPWFDVVDVAASERSSNQFYEECASERWLMQTEIPNNIKGLNVRNVMNFDSIPKEVKLFFSATELPSKTETKNLEFAYAELGFPVISNSSANRWTTDVPMIIPEINPDHVEIIALQQKNRKFPESGFVTAKPNCSIQSYLVALAALENEGFSIDKVQVVTMQALSGAGAKGVTNLEWRETVIPFIAGEEEKTEKEPLKILGKLTKSGIENAKTPAFSAVCARVPVEDGHIAVVQVSFKKPKPSIEEIKRIWKNFRGEPQILKLPSAPKNPIIFLDEPDRPQVKLDVNSENGMAVTIGRLEEDKFFDYRFVGLSHNTVRGAAGGAILTAELLLEKGFIR